MEDKAPDNIPTKIAPSTTTLVVAALCILGLSAYNLNDVAAKTGNGWGMVLSLIHVAIVSAAAILTLRE